MTPLCPPPRPLQLLQHLKRIISDLCKLYNLPQHPDVEMLDQPLPAEQVSTGGPAHTCPSPPTRPVLDARPLLSTWGSPQPCQNRLRGGARQVEMRDP